MGVQILMLPFSFPIVGWGGRWQAVGQMCYTPTVIPRLEITQQAIDAFIRRQIVLSEVLRNRLKDGFWIGPDVATPVKRTILPGNLVHLPVAFTDVPEIFARLDPAAFFYAGVSTRSRWAQLGLEVHETASIAIAESLTPIRQEPLDPYRYAAVVPVLNLSTRPIHVPEGSKLFRLFFYNAGSWMRGEELLENVSSGSIRLSGEPGEDWLLHERVDGILLSLNSNMRRWIPPDLPNATPLTISDRTGVDYRRIADSYLRPITPSRSPILWLTETSSVVTLDPSVHALIDFVLFRKGKMLPAKLVTHVNSRLIAGGETNWPLRAEIYGPTTEDLLPDAILLRFFSQITNPSQVTSF